MAHQYPTPEAPPGADTSQPRLRLGDVDDVVREHPAFTTPAIRTLIHRSKDNGLDKHIYRLGRKVMLDLDGFQQWIREKQEAQR